MLFDRKLLPRQKLPFFIFLCLLNQVIPCRRAMIFCIAPPLENRVFICTQLFLGIKNGALIPWWKQVCPDGRHIHDFCSTVSIHNYPSGAKTTNFMLVLYQKNALVSIPRWGLLRTVLRALRYLYFRVIIMPQIVLICSFYCLPAAPSSHFFGKRSPIKFYFQNGRQNTKLFTNVCYTVVKNKSRTSKRPQGGK